MPRYDYDALDPAGAKSSGVVEADSAKAARSQLRSKGLLPMRVEASGGSGAGASGSKSFSALSRTIWTRQLAGLVASGMALERALGALIDEADDPKSAALTESVRQAVQEGASLAKAMGRHPMDFPDVYVAVVGASEEGGDMGVALSKLADQLEGQEALKSKLVGAALYPAIVALIAVVVVSFLIAYVVPQVAGVFAHSKKELPALTKMMLALSSGFRIWGPWALGAMAIAGALFAKAMRSEPFRLSFDAWWLTLPVVGRMSRAYNASRYGGTLSMLCAAGVPIVKALGAAAQTLGNCAMRADALSVMAMVQEGAPLGACLAQKPRFPKLLASFARLGEQTGKLPEMLERASAQIGADVERRALRMATLMEPLLIVAMGAVVMLIVLSVMLPIVNMSSLAR